MLNPRKLSVPTELRRAAFHFVRQTLDHNEIDHEAVMASPALLREWSHSDWPQEHFSLADNRADLAGHIEDHEADLGYGYSILTPQRDRLLGSLYLEPVAPFIDDYEADPELRARLGAHDVRIDYWLREGSSEELERDVATAALGWLQDAWWFQRPVFATRAGMRRRRRLYRELGFDGLGSMRSHAGDRAWHFHRPRDLGQAGATGG